MDDVFGDAWISLLFRPFRDLRLSVCGFFIGLALRLPLSVLLVIVVFDVIIFPVFAPCLTWSCDDDFVDFSFVPI